MKVLQLIDSLNAGGAERVAVNYANSLTSRIEASYLCATREEGLLKESLSKNVQYLFLNKKTTLDFNAIRKLNKYVKKENVEIIHAHSTSFFLGTIIKILNPKITLIWHDHYGESEFLMERPRFVLKWCSRLFNHVITVNAKLENWSKGVLHVKSVSYLPNFAVKNNTKPITKLKGDNNKRITCLANLRPQKDHITLLKAFNKVQKTHSDWSLHLVGQYYEDDYYKSIKVFIEENKLEKRVFIYGSCADTNHILSQSTMGVLSSKSEGLPLALLEYGLAELPVIATNVGDCNLVVSNKKEGLLIEPENEKVLADALLLYMNDVNLRLEAAKNLHLKILSSFSESSTIDALVKIYKQHAI
ncbi:glycosyltransferase [Yeosuana sp.]|uniref:glycosyltransferase n=1 Tax=Yeosuana sp. TaxID=2529388 RepID=UPI004054A99E